MGNEVDLLEKIVKKYKYYYMVKNCVNIIEKKEMMTYPRIIRVRAELMGSFLSRTGTCTTSIFKKI